MHTFVSILLLLGLSMNVFAQKEPPPPYLKTKRMPAFKVYQVADSSVFTQKDLDKTKKTIIIFYGPDCGHCMVFAKRLMDSVHLIQDAQILMVTSFEFAKIQKFNDEFKMTDNPIITVGQDENFFFITHFGIRHFPSAYIYSPSGRFLKKFENEVYIADILKVKVPAPRPPSATRRRPR